jgi:hypothetical protein
MSGRLLPPSSSRAAIPLAASNVVTDWNTIASAAIVRNGGNQPESSGFVSVFLTQDTSGIASGPGVAVPVRSLGCPSNEVIIAVR